MAPPTLTTLPYELRNIIYVMVIEDIQNDNLGPIHLRNRGSRNANAGNWSRLKRTYLGFTQVCKLLREDFMPLYYGQFEFKIGTIDIYIWLTEIVVPVRQAMLPLQISTRVKNSHTSLDIYNLVLLLTSNNFREVTFEGDLLPMQHFIESAKRRPRWCLYFLECVEGVTFGARVTSTTANGSGYVPIPRGQHAIDVHVLPDEAESWMFDYNSDPSYYYQSLLKWRAWMGVRDLRCVTATSIRAA